MRTLFEAIRPVATEATWQSLARPALTPRESAVLCALFTHESRTELADALFVSVNTVKSQLRSLYAKLGVSTREQALARAVALGIAGDSDGDDAP
ncbi:MAG TPA: helix-turn-helix transcriptional regulator [Candidatus Microbacterium pullistercoris]|nr:helix-turn-helix transcriptional regulator [Candidatus Microbacterium pullistercoris]